MEELLSELARLPQGLWMAAKSLYENMNVWVFLWLVGKFFLIIGTIMIIRFILRVLFFVWDATDPKNRR